MKRTIIWLAGGGMAMAGMSVAAAPKTQQPRPEIFISLLQCRTIVEDGARLACFDRQSAAMDAAAQRDEVVVLDKSELKKTRKTLFGFSFPKLPFLGGGDDEKEEAREEEGFSHIDDKIVALRHLGYGKWQLDLEEGGRWATTEAITGREPGIGQMIEIRRAAMGGFRGKFAGGRAVRMRRVG